MARPAPGPSLSVCAGALALGLAMGLVSPLAASWLRAIPPDHALPDGYVGVLAGPEGRTGFVVSARRHGLALSVQAAATPGLPAGRTLYLWAVDGSGAVRGVGPLPAGGSGGLALAEPADVLLARAVGFGVSLEAAGARPDRPSGAFVYRGACGRLWRAEAAGA